jgi:hypothetical protein
VAPVKAKVKKAEAEEPRHWTLPHVLPTQIKTQKPLFVKKNLVLPRPFRHKGTPSKFDAQILMVGLVTRSGSAAAPLCKKIRKPLFFDGSKNISACYLTCQKTVF